MSLVKLVDSASFFREDEQLVSILDIGDGADLGHVKKAAADVEIQRFVSGIQPEKNKIYVHIIAMGAGEYWGKNRNADFFPEHALIDYHKTFETSPAYVYRNHVNKDPKKSIGRVLFAFYNSRMHRVELIAEIDKLLGPDIIDRIERGEWPSTSMACKTPYDVCAICGNKAHTRQEYCVHLREQLGKIYPDGRAVMAINSAPLKFFDISIVVRPADVTSSILQKVASETVEEYVGSVDTAESEGVVDPDTVDKQADFKKLSEFIKEIDEGMVADYSEALEPLLVKVKDPDLKIIDILRNFKTNDVLSAMAQLGISPSIAFLAELIGRKVVGESMVGVGGIVESLISHAGGAKAMEIPKEEPVASGDPSFALLNALIPYAPTSSYLPDHVEKRAMEMRVLPQTNVGYVGNGPHVEPTPYEKFHAANIANKGEDRGGLVSLINTLLSIGGAALAAKWYITRAIEQRMKQIENPNGNSHVKIVLLKTSSDYRVTHSLAKASMIKAIKS